MTRADRERDLRAMDLLEGALDRSSDAREQWIELAAGEDAALRDRALALLRAQRQSASSVRTGGAPDSLPADDPEQVGAYRVLERLGRGGMGAVYLGERVRGDFEHKVAIKVIKPGALSEPLVERFRREREILAQLSHPNIAQLFDGGETEAGEPYIVMEHVDGEPLSEWLARARPTLDARLALFLQICSAVSFAHQSLIVHRDLTPSNVLVTRTGQAKLIDFGISRPAEEGAPALAGEQRSEEAIANRTGTPGFSAPEREAGIAATTLGDIFSLGKVLELLVGSDSDEDLKAIIAKACAADPAARFPSADALADDVERYRAGQPVPARGGGRGYAIGKFARRHRLGVAAAASGIVLLIAALIVTLTAYARAESAREAEAARFAEVRDLANYMLFDLNGRMERVTGNAAARVALAARAQAYLASLAESPNASPELRHEAARGFIALARIQGVPTEPNLGQNEQARRNLQAAIQILRSPGIDRAAAAPDLVEALALLAMLQAHGDADMEGADGSLAEAETVLDSAPAESRGERWHSARSLLRRSQLEMTTLGQRPDRIIPLVERLESEIAEWPPAMRRSRAAAFDRAFAQHHRGLHGYFTDDLDAAVDHLLDAERMLVALDRALPNDPIVLFQLAWTQYVGYGAASGLEARAGLAPRFVESARGTIDRLLAIEPNDRSLRAFAATVRGAEAQMANDAGRSTEALAIQREVVALYEQSLGPERRASMLNRLATAHVTLANIGRDAGDRTLACASYRNAREELAELERRDELLGFVEAFGPALESNLRLCASGAPLGRFATVE